MGKKTTPAFLTDRSSVSGAALLVSAVLLIPGAAFAKACPGDAASDIEPADVVAFDKTCSAIREARNFFAENGMDASDRPVRISFMPEVRIPSSSHSDGKAFFGSGMLVVGFFDRAAGRISMTEPLAPWLRARPYFGLPFSDELFFSVVTHESAHQISSSFYKFTPRTHAQDEYVAYSAQLGSLSESTRLAVLKSKSDWTFSSPHQINDFLHAADPHGFGSASWRFHSSPGGGSGFLGEIYSGAFKPIDLADMP